MSALILFSGGKDSVLGYKKSINSGKIVEAGLGYGFSNDPKVDPSVVVAIADACGIPDFTMREYSFDEISTISLTKKLADEILLKKQSHPDIDTLIVGADRAQTLNMLLFYIRIAHAAGVSVYVPYYDSYDTEFFNDLTLYNLEVRLVNYKKYRNVEEIYNPNDVLPLSYLSSAFDSDDTATYSEIQTIITNADFYTHPVLTQVVNGVIQLK
jgi:diphthamide synthase (EF-2-diphthine--ammonia ligase)